MDKKAAEQPTEADRVGFCPPEGDSSSKNGRKPWSWF
jgi:hypothetical protein